MGLELHFHESILSIDRSTAGTEKRDDSDTETVESSSDEESSGRGGAVLGALLALAVLAGIAYAVRSRRGGDEEAEIEIDE